MNCQEARLLLEVRPCDPNHELIGPGEAHTLETHLAGCTTCQAGGTALAEAYEALRYPLGQGNIVSLVHIPSNTVVLEFRL